jgi:small GTP-binding protein
MGMDKAGMTAVLKKKVCMLGARQVGKTSLVRRFVESAFSEKYLATIGVKIDQKTVRAGERTVELLLWDIEGADELQTFQSAYLRGAAGYLVVADGTSSPTLEAAIRIREQVAAVLGDVPCILALNKRDLKSDWKVPEERVAALTRDGWTVILTSAKTGAGVEEAFARLAELMLA